MKAKHKGLCKVAAAPPSRCEEAVASTAATQRKAVRQAIYEKTGRWLTSHEFKSYLKTLAKV